MSDLEQLTRLLTNLNIKHTGHTYGDGRTVIQLTVKTPYGCDFTFNKHGKFLEVTTYE